MTNNKKSILDTLSLNEVQRQAVAYVDGPELVFAGAGTGKTRVLTAKIAYLIDHCGYAPSQIFAATFTNKAAREMRERVERFISAPVSGLWIGTFHSLCAKILRREAASIGYPASFTIYDASDQLSVIKKLMPILGIDDRAMPPKSLQNAISSRKSACVTPEECEARAVHAGGFREKEIARAYRAYQKALLEQQAMDFDDLISNVVYALRSSESLLAKYQSQFRYVLIDEYQDTNRAQFLLARLLSMGHGKIFAVGDDDQSIYGWRGAKVENILTFEKEFPDTKTFKLEENYRSTSAILNFANAAVRKNTARAPKELWTGRAAGAPVVVRRYRDDRQEAEGVALECEGLLKKMPGTNVAVLFRTNAQSRAFEESFRRRRVPYVLVGGTSFYERAEIKDCMAYLRLAVNQKDDVSFERILNTPPRGLGDKAKESITLFAKERGISLLQTVLSGQAELISSRAQRGFADLRELYEGLTHSAETGVAPMDILSEVLTMSGYMDMLVCRAESAEEERARVENVNELMNAIAAWQQENEGGTLSNFLEEVSLASDIDGWNSEENAVSFMTMHTAKGLEFRAVFLVGVEEGIIPSLRNEGDEAKIEEERRLFYVGSTRAMDTLVCSHADQRFRFGSIISNRPSPFLDDIPTSLYTFENKSAVYGGGSGRSGGSGGSGTTGTTGTTGRSGVSGAGSPSTRREAFGGDGGDGGGWGTGGSFGDDGDRPKSSSYISRKSASVSAGYDEFSQETEPTYRVGQTVTHKTYGKGRIVGISGFGADMKITVLGDDGVRRKFMAKFAKLE